MIHDSSQNGFTFIEMIVAISVFVLMMSAVTTFFIVLYKEQGSDIVRIKRVEIAGRAIETISSEIRKMNRAENGGFPLESAQDQTLIFYSDVDNDGLTERIRYYLNDTDDNLEKYLTEPGGDLSYSGGETMTIVVSDVKNGSNSVFEYYDESYTGTGDPLTDPVNVTEVKMIKIILDINTDENILSNPFHIETKIHPRNLKNFE